jgi:hypothetical protein
MEGGIHLHHSIHILGATATQNSRWGIGSPLEEPRCQPLPDLVPTELTIIQPIVRHKES